VTEPVYSIEDYAQATPETAQATAPEPTDDAGHILPADAWAAVVAAVEGSR
jgi:hypothetical protein